MKSKPRSNSTLRPMRISMFAFLPLLAICLLFLANVEAWEFLAVSYAMTDLFVAVLSCVFIIYLRVELGFRVNRLAGFAKVPWFSLVLSAALSSLFFAGQWAEPVVMQIPDWCRVSQKVRGETSNDGWFVLVLQGPGNAIHHEFRFGYLNCGLGKQRGGIPDIEFRPLKFGWWEGYDHVFVDASPSELVRHVSDLDYPENELDMMTADIWEILQQANRGDPLVSNTFDVEPIRETPNNAAHHKIGGVILMITSAMTYLVVGRLTLSNLPEKTI